VELLTIDIADTYSVRQALKQLEQPIDALDVLINNAGIAGNMPQDFISGSSENLRLIFDTNFFGTVQTTCAFLPLLRRSTAAQIINVSGEVGSITLRTATGRKTQSR
jgi:NAD(P)-dependent dehydrogenase (short-subunit alcohol dehydrogenase family)